VKVERERNAMRREMLRFFIVQRSVNINSNIRLQASYFKRKYPPKATADAGPPGET